MLVKQWNDVRSGIYEWHPDKGHIRLTGSTLLVEAGGFEENDQGSRIEIQDFQPETDQQLSQAELTP